MARKKNSLTSNDIEVLSALFVGAIICYTIYKILPYIVKILAVVAVVAVVVVIFYGLYLLYLKAKEEKMRLEEERLLEIKRQEFDKKFHILTCFD